MSDCCGLANIGITAANMLGDEAKIMFAHTNGRNISGSVCTWSYYAGEARWITLVSSSAPKYCSIATSTIGMFGITLRTRALHDMAFPSGESVVRFTHGGCIYTCLGEK